MLIEGLLAYEHPRSCHAELAISSPIAGKIYSVDTLEKSPHTTDPDVVRLGDATYLFIFFFYTGNAHTCMARPYMAVLFNLSILNFMV